jgi:FtsP/CotA-like multicopper oxidase with cupredoxin domain
MTRRELITLAFGLASSAIATPRGPADEADVTLRIGETTLDLAPKRSVRTLAYNDQVPGPLLRARAGRRVTVDVRNDARNRDVVHWHGFNIPPEVDGAYDEGTPAVPGNGGHQRYSFTAGPGGTRWYHSHDLPHRDLARGTYTGQFGMFIIDTADDRGLYDQEVPILLHEWEPRFTTNGPLDIEYRAFSINGKMLGYGEPIHVRQSERVLFRIVNASATLSHRLALPGHLLEVVALDGNRVPSPARVRVVEIAPGERVDAVAEMNNPGVWVLGETNRAQRNEGLGIVVEYARQKGPPRWVDVGPFQWDITAFSGGEAARDPDATLTMVFKAKEDGHDWTINGKSYPKTDPIVVESGKRYRWRLDNQSANDHPVHLHRHTFEVVRVGDKRASGIRKDVVVVPAWKEVEIDVVADQPGLSLFHCHQQFHMDMGFMTMMRYRS